MDMAGAAITVDPETMALQSGWGEHKGLWRRPYVWDDTCATAFARLQAVLTEAPVLAYPDARRPFTVDTDASDVGEERANKPPVVAAVQTNGAVQTAGDAEGWLPLLACQLEQQQRDDETLAAVRDWLDPAGRRCRCGGLM
ncbi:unnamed protein product [Merluccius merluccius]